MELGAIIQYLTYAAKATGPYRSRLDDMVRDESHHSEETERILRDWPI